MGLTRQQYQTLWDEWQADPQGLGYTADVDANTVLINTANQNRVRSTLSDFEVFEALDEAEVLALPADEREFLNRMIGMDDIPVGPGTKARAFFQSRNAAGTNTMPNTWLALLTVAVEQVSRAAILGLPVVRSGHFTIAEERHG